MTEKRFVLEISSFSGKHMKFLNILDNGKRLKSEDIVDLLNEQQATITKLKELNDDKGKRIISLIRTNKTLKEENEQLRQSVEYWQKKYEEGTETFQIN